MHGISGERNKLEGRMTTRCEDNRLGCVIKYLKKIFDQGYDVIMTSSIGPFFQKKQAWVPAFHENSRILSFQTLLVYT